MSERSQPVGRGCRWSRGVGRAFPTYYIYIHIYTSGNTIRICPRYIINYYYFLRSSRLPSVYCITRRHIFDVHISAYACVGPLPGTACSRLLGKAQKTKTCFNKVEGGGGIVEDVGGTKRRETSVEKGVREVLWNFYTDRWTYLPLGMKIREKVQSVAVLGEEI